MDYLVVEGYKSAAEEFSRETGISSAVELATIENRMNIREAVQRGDVEEAIERVNDLNPEVSLWFVFVVSHIWLPDSIETALDPAIAR